MPSTEMEDRRRHIQNWIADEMVRLRETAGFTLRQMGDLMGRSETNYNKYEMHEDKAFRAINLADYILLVTELEEANILPTDDYAVRFVNAIVPRRHRRRAR